MHRGLTLRQNRFLNSDCASEAGQRASVLLGTVKDISSHVKLEKSPNRFTVAGRHQLQGQRCTGFGQVVARWVCPVTDMCQCSDSESIVQSQER